MSNPLPAPSPPPPPLPVAVVADGVDRQLDHRVIKLWRLEAWIVAGSLSIISFVFLAPLMLLSPLPGASPALIFGAWLIAVLALAWRAYAWPPVVYRHTSYRVDGQGIEIKRGVLWRRVINVPRSRVQHTDVTQGPIARRYGLSTLAIYTAGSSHAMVALEGLERETAMRIRDYLLPSVEADAV